VLARFQPATAGFIASRMSALGIGYVKTRRRVVVALEQTFHRRWPSMRESSAACSNQAG
jgi:hypothetical protein